MDDSCQTSEKPKHLGFSDTVYKRFWLTSLRNVSLLFLASSLEVSASAVLVENYNTMKLRV